MTAPSPATALEPFLTDPGTAAVLCDLDGTLAPIVSRPDQARVPEQVRVALARIADRYALAAVTLWLTALMLKLTLPVFRTFP